MIDRPWPPPKRVLPPAEKAFRRNINALMKQHTTGGPAGAIASIMARMPHAARVELAALLVERWEPAEGPSAPKND